MSSRPPQAAWTEQTPSNASNNSNTPTPTTNPKSNNALINGLNLPPMPHQDDEIGRSSSSVRFRQGNNHMKIFQELGTTHNAAVDGLLTDFYQITMAYAYWKSGKHEQRAVFDAYFRKCPFKGEYCICAGINETVRFLNTFGYTPSQISYLREQMPSAEQEFFAYLESLDASNLTVMGMREGEIVFPNQPLLRLEGPLIVFNTVASSSCHIFCQLLETTVLNLLNFPSLIATNAARYRQAATGSGPTERSPRAAQKPVLIEMGTRRAQGPDGALSASRYSYLGGFDATSNVKAGHVFQIPIKGTHAHAFVTSFAGLDDLKAVDEEGDDLCATVEGSGAVVRPSISSKRWSKKKFKEDVLSYRKRKNWESTHDGELAAFISYAIAFPDSFLALVDTYGTLESGVRNFLCVALALLDRGHKPVGVRLDSGDLAYLSKEAKEMFRECADGDHIKSEAIREHLHSLKVCASNDINERTLQSLNEQGHGIDIYGIGTNLVTCQAQPALGMVYKLAELDGSPCMKLSQEFTKVSVPCKKMVYRLYNSKDQPLIDLMCGEKEPAPEAGKKLFCRHLFDETKRCYVTPTKVEPLLHQVWGERAITPMSLSEAREFSMERLVKFRQDILRPLNPTPYKLSVTDEFFTFFKQLWQKSAPVPELS